MSEETISYTIRDIPAATYNCLKQCAEANHRSVHGELRFMIDEHLARHFVDEQLEMAINRETLFDYTKLMLIHGGITVDSRNLVLEFPEMGVFDRALRKWGRDELGFTPDALPEVCSGQKKLCGLSIKVIPPLSWKRYHALDDALAVLHCFEAKMNPGQNVGDAVKLWGLSEDGLTGNYSLNITEEQLRRWHSHGYIHEDLEPATQTS